MLKDDELNNKVQVFSVSQADCPQVTGIITALIITSSQFRIEEVPASNGIVNVIIKTNIIINNSCIFQTVHPVPGPFSTKALNKSNNSEGGNNQKEMLFNLGKAIKFVIDSFLIMNLL